MAKLPENPLRAAQLRTLELERQVERLRTELERVVTVVESGENVTTLLPRLRRAVRDYRQFWTRELIVDKVHEWVELYGSPPAAADWSPAAAKRQGGPSAQQKIDRFLDGEWPQYSVVTSHFGSWSALIREAGHQPGIQGHGKGGGTRNPGGLPQWTGWQHLQALRQRLKLTQGQVALAAGLSAGTYQDLESGRNDNPQIRTILAIAQALQVRPEGLVS